ncbi:hypothetical protein M422DRAFT_256219 [Sphaerobolus stellatus SS14]|uniref:DUF6534 domain-containing protein n=1 Tax=Sphaerobolus stellatus (strain SS14) TaxID=990650 RepID=A0A0C9VS14_SPHS4|nr:hypothetical protein M422DRAFT_256219 [Sphaerobolus stellatus SS14]
MPGVKIPSFDNTLGALFIGSSLTGILFGVGCLQMFLWMTGKRAESDRPWFKTFVFLLLFFCWRIWILSATGFEMPQRIVFTVITTILAMFNFGTNVFNAVKGFDHRIFMENTPDFILAYKLATGSQVAFDVMVTFAMTLSLHRARSGIARTDHVITLITLFTVNTNLLTTLLTISALVTFLTLPSAAVYGGIGFLVGRTYFNSFLAVLNSRDFLSEKLNGATSFSTGFSRHNGVVKFSHSNGQMAETSATTGGFDISSVDIPSFNKEPMIGEV